MARTVAIGVQDFETLVERNCFYVDKSAFIREWWESEDSVTLITRPRRFGKTLNMSMLERFFSLKYAGKGELFEGLDIWKEEKYRNLQGTYPVIFLSFAPVKATNYSDAREHIYSLISDLYNAHFYLLDSGVLTGGEKEYFLRACSKLNEIDAVTSLNKLSNFMSRYYGKKVIILLDEYDTPMQEAYVSGYWNKAAQFFRSLFNATFKTNPYMERAMITGITRISKESMFSDLNNLKVISTTSKEYATAFGFTEEEVFAGMEEYGLTEKDEMKRWYDGFTFGDVSDIYNPWSVINALREREYKPYWVNTSSNALLNRIMKQGNADLKMQMEELLRGGSIACDVDEEIVYNRLDTGTDAVWSLMLATGYLKVEKVERVGKFNKQRYTLRILNLEVEEMLNDMVKGWFDEDKANYNGFIQALLLDDVRMMNKCMNKFSLNMFSYFDTGSKPSESSEPERFYHGFVLGLMVDLEERYVIRSNRESGFGRYDVMMIPKNKDDKAFIFEFKVKDADDDETTLEDTLQNAHAQIEEKQYAQELVSSGILAEHIRKYGFAFEGKKVLIG
jgi:hypothetical protein